MMYVYDPKKLVNGEGPNVISTAVAYMKPWTTIIDSFDSADEPALNDEMENIGGDDSVNCFALVERNKKREEEEFVNPEKKADKMEEIVRWAEDHSMIRNDGIVGLEQRSSH